MKIYTDKEKKIANEPQRTLSLTFILKPPTQGNVRKGVASILEVGSYIKYVMPMSMVARREQTAGGGSV